VADWVTISSLATAGGTLVLGVATFAAVRSANRSARVAERAFAATVRPVLVLARDEDPEQRVPFVDGHRLAAHGALAGVETDGATVWLALALTLHGLDEQRDRTVEQLRIGPCGERACTLEPVAVHRRRDAHTFHATDCSTDCGMTQRGSGRSRFQ